LRTSVSFTQNRFRQVLQPLPPGFTAEFAPGVSATFPAGVFTDESLSSRRYGIEGTWERPAGDHQFVAGLGLGRESAFDLSVQSSYDFHTQRGFELPRLLNVGDESARTLFAAFVQDTWSPSASVTLTGGLRYDHVGAAASELSPRAAVVFSLPNDTRLKLLYGRAFRAPTFAESELAIPVLDGNASVDPLHVDTIEAALSVRRSRFRFGASLYATFLRDGIAPLGAFTTTESRPAANTAGSDLRGVELEVRRSFGVGNSVFLNYAYQHSEDRPSGTPMAGCPSHLGNLGASLSFGDHFRAMPLWSFRSSRPRAAGDNRAETAGYGLISVTLRALNVHKTLSFALTAQNLLDKHYFDPSPFGGVPGDYPRPGIRVLVSATYEF
jgi:outer membrane receptor protein involved in Fe transport